MTEFVRPLAGLTIGISISKSNDSDRRGFPSWQVNRTTVQIVAALFSQGAGVVFGHDWREDGVMEAMCNFARQVQAPVPAGPDGSAAEKVPLMRNLLPWPAEPRLNAQERERLAPTLIVQPAGLPPDLQDQAPRALKEGVDSPIYAYVRSRGLTHLRHLLNDACDARICIGGKTSGYTGRYPGIIEEAWFAIQSGKPLYVIGFLGGAAQGVANALQGERVIFEESPKAKLLYRNPPVFTDSRDAEFDLQSVSKGIRDFGVEQFSATNHLAPEQNRELFTTPLLDRAIALVLTGLSTLPRHR